MKNPLSLLVVEDNLHHLADVQFMLVEEMSRLPIKINMHLASDLEEANRKFPQADAVMTDVFFPATQGGNAQEANGQKVVERCLAEQKPAVWVTSTYHHGQKTDAVNNWGRERGLEMFDAEQVPRKDRGGIDIYEDMNAEIPHKPWKLAFYALLYLIFALEDGHCAFIEGKIMTKNEERFSPNGYEPGIGADQLLSKVQIDPEREPTLARMIAMGFPRS